jgi:hypothetical protein
MLHLRAGVPDGAQAAGNPVASLRISIVDDLRIQSPLHGMNVRVVPLAATKMRDRLVYSHL